MISIISKKITDVKKSYLKIFSCKQCFHMCKIDLSLLLHLSNRIKVLYSNQCWRRAKGSTKIINVKSLFRLYKVLPKRKKSTASIFHIHRNRFIPIIVHIYRKDIYWSKLGFEYSWAPFIHSVTIYPAPMC